MKKHPDAKNWEFDGLATWVIGELFNALITGGTRGMKTHFWIVYGVICQWQDLQDAKKRNR